MTAYLPKSFYQRYAEQPEALVAPNDFASYVGGQYDDDDDDDAQRPKTPTSLINHTGLSPSPLSTPPLSRNASPGLETAPDQYPNQMVYDDAFDSLKNSPTSARTPENDTLDVDMPDPIIRDFYISQNGHALTPHVAQGDVAAVDTPSYQAIEDALYQAAASQSQQFQAQSAMQTRPSQSTMSALNYNNLLGLAYTSQPPWQDLWISQEPPLNSNVPGSGNVVFDPVTDTTDHSDFLNVDYWATNNTGPNDLISPNEPVAPVSLSVPAPALGRKNDLLNIDQFPDQSQSIVYENTNGAPNDMTNREDTLSRLMNPNERYEHRISSYANDIKVVANSTRPSIAKDCGWIFGHQKYNELQQNLLTVICSLGHGSVGVVEEVRVSAERPSFVRKRIQLPYSYRKQRLRIIKQEAEALELLVHSHIVKIIGSYQDGSDHGKQFYSLLMFPVGEQDLKTFLEMVGDPSWEGHQDSNKKEKIWLQKWFKCLASALSYMHSQGIRHEDIKPSNIIHKGDNIFFTDFSSASRFQVGQTTSTENPARTSAMYSAPEVINRGETLNKHGRGTDVFALGIVFCEMLTVMDGRSLDEFHQFCLDIDITSLEAEAAKKILLYGRCTQKIHDWFSLHLFYHLCIRPMLALNREDRPYASAVEERIRNFLEWTKIPCSCDTEYF